MLYSDLGSLVTAHCNRPHDCIGIAESLMLYIRHWTHVRLLLIMRVIAVCNVQTGQETSPETVNGFDL